MRKLILLVAVLFVVSLATGCTTRPRGKAAVAPPPTQPLTPQEALAQQAIDLLNEATGLLAAIKDRASAAAAAPKLKAIAQKLQDLNRRGVPLGSQVNENPQAVGRLKSDLEKAVQGYANAGVRVLANENVLGPEIQEALRDLGKLPQ